MFVSPLVSRFALLARSVTSSPVDRLAVEDDQGSWGFGALWEKSLSAAALLLDGAPSLEGRAVAILVSPGAPWLVAFWSVLLAGGVVLPLSPAYPPAELLWFGEDANASIVIVSDEFKSRSALLEQGRRVLDANELFVAPPKKQEPALRGPDDVAMLLYTSGTTGKPKGAMITHANVEVQASILRNAWGWRQDDRLLHALPLHHLHGLGISLMTSFLAGGATRMLSRFDARRVWDFFASSDPPTTWMAVPTMYQRLFEVFDAADMETQSRWAEGARRLRLATSGSAALPVKFAERWRAMTGTIPLERFGMTEIGVGATNPLVPEGRRPGHVGFPPETVEAKIVDEAGNALEKGPGELWIRGPSVFKGYLGREKATAEAFSQDGWFKTGDVAERSAEGAIRLLGRTSVDILKSGGYKLSALEIEEALRENPVIREVAVVGVPDEAWGDRVVAVVCVAEPCTSASLRAWAKERMAAYKVPREFVVVEALPRNAMGKVVKPEVVRLLRASAGLSGGTD